MYVYEEHEWANGERYRFVKDTGWKEIREQLVDSMNNSGIPYIVVVDGDYNKANELYLRHEFDGNSLDPDYIKKTLPYIYQLWHRPVHIETWDIERDAGTIYSYDGSRVSHKFKS